MSFQIGKDTTSDDLEDIHQTILTSVASNIAATITANSYGAMNADDPKTDGFYIIQFTSPPYTLQNDIEVNGDKITSGNLVCDAEYLSPAQKGSNWYVTPSKNDVLHVVIEMSKVLVTNIPINIVTGLSELDRNMKTLTKSDLRIKKPFLLTVDVKNQIIDEIRRRDCMEYTVGGSGIIESEEI